MKWTHQGQKAGSLLQSVLRPKALFYLLAIAALGLVLGAGFKWHP